MCACGDLDPSYVCSKHRDTPDDWSYVPPPDDDERHASELGLPDFRKPFEGWLK